MISKSALDELTDLVLKATSIRHSSSRQDHFTSIKTLCKQSDQNVELTFELLYQRLKQPNSQVRLLALELCNELFNRSKLFRSLLTARFTHFLELATGFKSQNPLPQPSSAASALQERAFHILEKWNSDYGPKYKQVALGYDYLQSKLRLTNPGLSDQANQEAVASNAARSEELRRFQQVCEEQPALFREYVSVVDQMEECMVVLHEREARQQPEQQKLARLQAQVEAYEGDDVDWEDIAAPRVASPTASLPEEDAVVEAMRGLYKELTIRIIPAARRWLRVLSEVRLAPGDAAQHAQRQDLEGQTTDLLSKLIDCRHKCEQALPQPLHPPAAQEVPADSGEAAVHLDDLFDQGNAEPRGGGQEPYSLDPNQELPARKQGRNQQQQQQQQSSSEAHAGGAGAPQQALAGSAEQHGRQHPSQAVPCTQQQHQQQHQQDKEPPKHTPSSDVRSPYATLRDPAAPRQKPVAERKDSSGGGGSRAEKPGAELPRPQRGGSSLPEIVKRQLAEKAPVLPGGLYTQYWDTNAAPVYVSGHGLEVSNHWGPVDVHAELPPERVEELFMHAYTVPSALQREEQQQQPSGSRADSTQKPQSTAGPSNRAGTKAGQSSGSNSAAKIEGGGSQRSELPGTGFLGVFSEEEGRAAKRARRATERAYNEAVLGGAMADEQLAQQLHQTELARMAAQEQQSEEKSSGIKQPTKPKLTVRERLQKKLMKGRAAAERDLSTMEAERYRDSNSNRWENK